MTRIVLAEAAREDRHAITAHTVERFGIRQARRLRANFERVLNLLADTPTIGHLRDELDPPGHTFLRIPVDSDHRFQCKPITDSIANRSPVPEPTDH